MPRQSSRKRSSSRTKTVTLPERLDRIRKACIARGGGGAMMFIGVWLAIALASFSISDPSWNNATTATVSNTAGTIGAAVADFSLQFFGGAVWAIVPAFLIWGGVALLRGADIIEETTPKSAWLRIGLAPVAVVSLAAFCALLPVPVTWPFSSGVGGLIGDSIATAAGAIPVIGVRPVLMLVFGICAFSAYAIICGLTIDRLNDGAHASLALYRNAHRRLRRINVTLPERAFQREEDYDLDVGDLDEIEPREEDVEEAAAELDVEQGDLYEEQTPRPKRNIVRNEVKKNKSKREAKEVQPDLPVFSASDYELPPLNLFAKPPAKKGPNGIRRSVGAKRTHVGKRSCRFWRTRRNYQCSPRSRRHALRIRTGRRR